LISTGVEVIVSLVSSTSIPSRNVIVVPCGARKNSIASEARSLYTGSLFTEVLAAAVAEVGEENVLILSALHGLLPLDEVVAPYECKMGDAGALDRRDSGLMELAAQVICFGLHRTGTTVYTMLPNAYERIMDEALRLAGGTSTVPVYEATAGMGEHKAIAKGMRTAA
jgi:hypothetical protein